MDYTAAIPDSTRLDTPVLEIPLESIVVFNQVRKQFDQNETLTLAVSIFRGGQLQPLLVSPLEEGKFRLISGERRLRALYTIKRTHAYVRVISCPTPEVILRIQLQENLMRQNLNVIEQTQGLLNLLMLELKLTPEETQAALAAAYRDPGESPIDYFFMVLNHPTLKTFYSHHLPLLRLPDAVQQAIASGDIAPSKAMAQQRRVRETTRGDASPRAETLFIRRMDVLCKRLKTVTLDGEQEKVVLHFLNKIEALFKN